MARVTTTSASQPTTSPPSWRSTLEIWGARGVAGGAPGVAGGAVEVETEQGVVEAGLRRSVSLHTSLLLHGRLKTLGVLIKRIFLCPQGGGVSVPNVDDPEAFPALA